VEVWASRQHGTEETGASLDNVLTVVENQQDPALAERIGQQLGYGLGRHLGQTENRRDLLSHKGAISQGRELNQPYAVGLFSLDCAANNDRKSRLTATAATNQAHQLLHPQHPGDGSTRLGSTDEARQVTRQVVQSAGS
jgi:hypothetical protein